MKKPPEGGVIKLRVRTLLMADPTTVNLFALILNMCPNVTPTQPLFDQQRTTKVAVVLPVYNTARYLRECLDSILAQSHKNFVVFAVDDGSTDTSGQILDEYAAKDQRICYLPQKEWWRVLRPKRCARCYRE